MDSEELESRVRQITALLEDSKENPVVGGYVPPYIGKGEIKFVIIGQDPTVRNPKSREKITCTLNLDKNGSLRAFVERICRILNVSMDNLYATNLFKYFYTVPPANTPDVLKKHLEPNLELLKEELASLNLPKNTPIITLGQPVLRLLLKDDVPSKMKNVRYYWDYDKGIHYTGCSWKFVKSKDNALSSILYPLCHQPSLRKGLYRECFGYYLEYIRDIGPLAIGERAYDDIKLGLTHEMRLEDDE